MKKGRPSLYFCPLCNCLDTAKATHNCEASKELYRQLYESILRALIEQAKEQD